MVLQHKPAIKYMQKFCQLRGSVCPASCASALPCGLIAALVRWLINEGKIPYISEDDSILNQTFAWAGFSSLVGFLIVFRTSQAYSRFWEGITATRTMRSEWFGACSAIIAFCEHSDADQAVIMSFKHTLVRLISMIHASALADLMDTNNLGKEDDVTAFTYELIDPQGIDAASRETLRTSEARVELIFAWIQALIVRNIRSGVLNIPPPILSRVFQDIAKGMVAFHDAAKLSFIPFPFPYAQNCDLLLLIHWCLAPFVFSQWVSNPLWAFLFVFAQVFVLWSLNFIAMEIENPFGNDKNDLDGHYIQNELNRHLLLLLKPSTMTIPTLSDEAMWSADPTSEVHLDMHDRRQSFIGLWRADSERSANASRQNTDIGSPGGVQGMSKVPSSKVSDELRFSIGPSECNRGSNILRCADGVEPSGTQQLGRPSVASSQQRSQVDGRREQPPPREGQHRPVDGSSFQGPWEVLPKNGASTAAEGDRMPGSSIMTPQPRISSQTTSVNSNTSVSQGDANESRRAAEEPGVRALAGYFFQGVGSVEI